MRALSNLLLLVLVSIFLSSCAILKKNFLEDDGSLGEGTSSVRYEGTSVARSLCSGKSSGITDNSPVISLFKIAHGAQGEGILLSVHHKGEITAWCGAERTPHRVTKLSSVIDDATVSRDARAIAIRSGRDVELYSLSGEGNGVELRGAKRRLDATPLDMSFSVDAESLLFATADGSILRWKLSDRTGLTRDGALFEKYVGPSSAVSSVVPHPLGRMFFTGDWDGAVNGWVYFDADRQEGRFDENLFTGQFVADQAERIRFDRGANFEPVEVLVISGDGSRIGVGLRNGTLELWNLRGPRKVGEVAVHASAITTAAYSENGDLIATTGRDGKVNLISVRGCKKPEPGKLCVMEVTRTFDVLAVRSLVFIGDELFAGTASGNVVSLDYQTSPNGGGA